ncbi:hypothetical protein GEOBRER4_n2773 [Citrifermentans bremense]|uniref:Phospholipase D-like domain-containing protein n=1 Tax=Citrifermentans bremense TaxID=60035 RepID=A0A6S6M0P1_9BACT|nr:phospholipase D-like domain-containing protein [Citrifermentans bremense]BCG47922.1 hypothetical protein GEOBRER4_n2773 [Citrifermentans bremense]
MAFRSIRELRGQAKSPLEMIKQVFKRPDLAGLTGITIVSAYTDPWLLGRLVREIKKLPGIGFTLRVLLDESASGYHRDDEVTEALDELAQSLTAGRKFNRQSGIHLVNLGRLLHSKVIALHEPDTNHVALGSLNFTTRGFFINEEIVAHLERRRDADEALNYVQALFAGQQCRQVPFNRTSRPAGGASAREWLLQGRMFFDDKATKPFNFRLGLPEQLLRQPNFIVPGAEMQMPDNISILNLLQLPRAKEVAKWKRFCIATCYGYWCPAQFIDVVRENIDAVNASRRDMVVEQVLTKADELRFRFLTTFEVIEDNIREFNREHQTRYRWDRKAASNRLDNWIPRVINKLKDKKNLQRLLAGVDDAVVPDLWTGDEIALREFEESFCSHLVLEVSKSKITNMVALWLSDWYAFSEGLDLSEDWDEARNDEDAWHAWLQTCLNDPFQGLPADGKVRRRKGGGAN